MVHQSLWLVLPSALAWLLQQLFDKFFHPALSEREITSEGKKEMNPYFNVGYASTPHKKQKKSFQNMLYVFAFSLYAIIALPILWTDNPIDRVLNEDMTLTFSATYYFAASLLSAMYINDLIWIGFDDVMMPFHHLAAILAVIILVTDSTLLPTGLVLIRSTSIPFQDALPCLVAVLTRFNWVTDIKFWNIIKVCFYIGTCLTVFALEWLYFIYYYKGNNVVVYGCVIWWQLTETYGFHVHYGLLRNLPQIIKKKIERETKYMTDLGEVKQDPCGESLPTVVHCELPASG